MARLRRIEEIIRDIEKMHEQDPKDGLSPPFIINVPPRGPSYYNRFLNLNEDSLWVERRVDSNQIGPPLLSPKGEEWFDEEKEEAVSGIRNWPRFESFIAGPLDHDGIDALAWYRSFHYEPISKWGIYLLDKGIYYLAEKFEQQFDSSEKNPENRQKCIEEAISVLYYHELFHFYTDLAAANMEIEAYRAMYVDYFASKYSDGWEKSDGAPASIPSMLEESLANEFARSKTIRGKSENFQRELRKFMSRQPDGYKHWQAVKHNQRWKLGLSKLGERILNDPEPIPKYLNVRALEDAIEREYEWQVPVYIVDTIPDDIHRFVGIKAFNKIIISDRAKKLLRKLKNPILAKKVNARINKLTTTTSKFDKNLEQLNRPGWWKYNLGKSGDAHGNPRMILREAGASNWVLEWVGKHSEYDKWRAKQGI